MPSDDRARPVLQVLAGAIQGFHATLTATADDISRLLDTHAATRAEQQARYTEELGPFARGRVNVDRFVALCGQPASANGASAALLRRARAALADLLGREEAVYAVSVAPGDELVAVVARRLADIGRAFAAARVARDVQASGRPAERHVAALDGLPFSQWSRGERQLAPVLVVEVHGADLRPAGLAEFLDGRLKLVLLVSGETSPAPLVRLVTPSVFVQQAETPGEMERFAAWTGPGIAALVPPTAARFAHDPAGPSPGDRVRVGYTPQDPPRRAIAGLSVAQQMDELAMLAALTRQPAPTAAPTGEAHAADPAERLAGWLLAQAGFGGSG